MFVKCEKKNTQVLNRVGFWKLQRLKIMSHLEPSSSFSSSFSMPLERRVLLDLLVKQCMNSSLTSSVFGSQSNFMLLLYLPLLFGQLCLCCWCKGFIFFFFCFWCFLFFSFSLEIVALVMVLKTTDIVPEDHV